MIGNLWPLSFSFFFHPPSRGVSSTVKGENAARLTANTCWPKWKLFYTVLIRLGSLIKYVSYTLHHVIYFFCAPLPYNVSRKEGSTSTACTNTNVRKPRTEKAISFLSVHFPSLLPFLRVDRMSHGEHKIHLRRKRFVTKSLAFCLARKMYVSAFDVLLVFFRQQISSK